MKKGIINSENICYINHNGVEYIQFKNLKKYDNAITHCFTTRKGGVSSGECESLNLGFSRKDSRDNVMENFKRVAKAISVDCRNMVFANQVHDNKIKEVGEGDRGKGITEESDIIGYDGLVTNQREVALVTFYADCVPVFFYDPEKNVIAVSHSGWRGTVKKISAQTVNKMQNAYGCRAENIEAAIGPSIGRCCFEVGEEVYREFVDKMGWSDKFCKKTGTSKWHIDLQEIIKKTLTECGVREENICMCNICTRCNRDVFFSHRGDHGKTGSMAAIIQLR
ncbi:MAG: peptidoglycan editing factor PgeF [Clostridiales bacterium]|nr:peptidoglycan editing factor PgeF [Eubacteriales bacterium]MDH7565161.1 peptidoglycan editing factor PgeF [Clostridiales bacterium]